MFELRVLTGLHQGAALPLVGEQWLIGSHDELDLALHDPGVEQRHCRLRRDGERWTLNAEDGAVLDDEGHALATLQPGSPFVLGSVWLAVAAADTAWPTLPVPAPGAAAQGAGDPPTQPSAGHSAARRRPSLFNRVTLITVGILVGVVGSAWSLSHSDAPSEAALVGTGVDSAAGQSAPPAAGDHRTRLSAEQAQLRLKTMLSDRLLNDVTVEQTAKGLVLRGNLQEEARPVYQRMLERFEGSYQIPVALVDEVSAGGSALPFVIVQIMSGPQAHLVTADGKRLYVGDELAGLRLTRIDDGRVEFEGERHYEVRW
ncbi:FHA domain-containing protein [Pseudomonas typographi]|uniref:Type III secretion protein n=1 Tax=Pseudomonas typographi TaxID=2715964 RepID=A0ABR7Z7W7_9PSED|nr:FHA domain-containing protein [Pseudomonas typographi]MBD1554523.1 hypothetical protein [Pseudomonas typographi]MBD1601363.1 hypothetical protein [Pseudomonas typographi]